MIFGIGTDDATPEDKLTIFYKEWVKMLRVARNTSMTVSPEFALFSTFKAWMATQTYAGLRLTNRLAGVPSSFDATTTCFVSNEVFAFLAKAGIQLASYDALRKRPSVSYARKVKPRFDYDVVMGALGKEVADRVKARHIVEKDAPPFTFEDFLAARASLASELTILISQQTDPIIIGKLTAFYDLLGVATPS